MSESFVFGVDLDGVCANYTEGFRAVVAADRGIEPDELPIGRSWGFQEWDLSEEEFDRLHHRAVVDERMLRHLAVMDECADVLWRLSDAGVWIRIITHRLYINWGHATVVSDTVTWLDESRIPYRDLCFLGNKPDVGADVYIDDAPHNVHALRAAGNDVIVFDQPYNQDLDGPRATAWSEVEELVMTLAASRGAVQPQLPGIDAGADRLARRRSPAAASADLAAGPGPSADLAAGAGAGAGAGDPADLAAGPAGAPVDPLTGGSADLADRR